VLLQGRPPDDETIAAVVDIVLRGLALALDAAPKEPSPARKRRR